MIGKGEHYPFSEAHYRLAMEAAGVGMWDWDLPSNQQVWTRECKAMGGLPLDDSRVSYEHLLSLIYPEDRPQFTHVVNDNLRNRTELGVEFRVVWPDGSLHWIYAKGRGIYNEKGEPVRMIGVAFEVTARKQAEEEQRRAERRIHDILNSVGDAYAHLDKDWRFTYINSQAVNLGKAFAREKILGYTVWELYPEIVGTATDRLLHRVMATRQPATDEIYYPYVGRWYNIRVYPAEDGGITSFLADITERKSLEQERERLLEQECKARREAEVARQRSEKLVIELEQQRTLLQAIVKQAPSGLIIAEAPRGNIVIYNEEAARLMGHEILEHRDYTSYAQHGALHTDRTHYRAEEYPLARALLKGETIHQEYMLYQRSDGNLVHLSISAAPIRDPQGQMLAAIVAFNDISERYELERKKDEFMCMASHELRTPLTSLKGNLQLSERRLQHLLAAEENLLPMATRAQVEPLAAWNKRALRQVNIESRLINDLLDATRIQTGSLHVFLEPKNLLQIVRDTVEDVRILAPARTLHLELPARSEVIVMLDQVRISQVITNYLTNALKYSSAPQPVIVGFTLEEKEARVWVRDFGPGLSPEAQIYVWDRFRQVSSFATYPNVDGGLGLGLYISQALIRQHGGHTGVESTLGAGSTFWFSLPLASED